VASATPRSRDDRRSAGPRRALAALPRQRSDAENPDRLDLVAKRLAATTGRRGALRTLLGASLAGAAALATRRTADAGAKCFIRGKRCRYDRQCCSRDCRFGSCR
jgi:hypothetical protein